MPSADAAAASSVGPVHRLLRRLIDVTPAELPALGWCWLYIFSVLASYYILRPIRDQMGVAGGVNNLPWLFTGTLDRHAGAERAVLGAGEDAAAAASSSR